DVHALGIRAVRADRHRVLRGRARLLAQPHVDRHLPALEAGAHLVRAAAGLLALDTAARVTPLAGAQAAADALPVLARRRRLQRGEIELSHRPGRGGEPFSAYRRVAGSPRARPYGRSSRAR